MRQGQGKRDHIAGLPGAGLRRCNGLVDAQVQDSLRDDDRSNVLPVLVQPDLERPEGGAFREIQVVQSDCDSHQYPLSAYGYVPNGTHTCDVLSSSPVGCGAQEIRRQINSVECELVPDAAPSRTAVLGMFSYCSAFGKGKS